MLKQININKNIKVLLCLIVLVFLANHLFVYMGRYDDDDVNYARLAAKLSDTNRLNTLSHDHFEHRWVSIVITAFFYKIGGVNIYTTAAVCCLCCLAIGLTIYKLLKQQNNNIILLSFALFFLNYEIIFQSHRLLPDIAIALFIFLAFNVYSSIEFAAAKSNKNIIFKAFLFGLIFIVAIITKETIYITLPLWVYLFIKDILKKRNSVFWISSITSFALLLFCYLLFYKLQTNHWLYRLEVLSLNSYLNECSYDVLPKIETIKRVGYGLTDNFLLQGYMLVLLPAICCFIYRKKIFADAPKFKLLSVSFIILLLASNFMSLSFKTYFPLCPTSRHFLFSIPFATILSGFMLIAFFKQPKQYYLLPALFVIADIRLHFSNLGSTRFIYYLLTAILVFALMLQYLNVKKKYAKGLTILFVLVFAIKGFSTFFIEPYPFYFQQEKMITILTNKNQKATIFCNSLETQETSELITKFKSNNCIFLELTASSLVTQPSTNNIFFLLNCASETGKAASIHQEILGILPTHTVFYNDENVYLYALLNDTYLKNILTIIKDKPLNQ